MRREATVERVAPVRCRREMAVRKSVEYGPEVELASMFDVSIVFQSFVQGLVVVVNR